MALPAQAGIGWEDQPRFSPRRAVPGEAEEAAAIGGAHPGYLHLAMGANQLVAEQVILCHQWGPCEGKVGGGAEEERWRKARSRKKKRWAKSPGSQDIETNTHQGKGPNLMRRGAFGSPSVKVQADGLVGKDSQR